jgi:hypothetical protein
VTDEKKKDWTKQVKAALKALNTGDVHYVCGPTMDPDVTGWQLWRPLGNGTARPVGGVYSPARMCAFIAGMLEGRNEGAARLASTVGRKGPPKDTQA